MNSKPSCKWRYLFRQFILLILGFGISVFIGNSIVAHQSDNKNQAKTFSQAQLASFSRSLSPNFFCSNNNALRVPSWQDSNFVEAVQRLNPKKIRFPGGTVSNYWDWRYGGLIEDFRDGKADFFYSFNPEDAQYNSSKLSDLLQGLTLTNTEPVFVLNLSTSDLASQLEMLRTAKNIGLPVKYIELGNELYIDVSDNKDVFPRPKDYAAETVKWIDAIRQEFPSAQIAVVGVTPTSRKPRRLKEWNSSLLPEALPKADAIVLHIYGSHGLGKDESKIKTYPFFDSEDTKTILGKPFAKWQEVQNTPQYKLLPKDKKIWITEYNLFESIFYNKNKGRKPKVMGSWAHGLYTATMSLLFLEEPRVEFICNHQLISNFYFASILPEARSFKDPVSQSPIATPYSLSAAGSALSLYANAIDGMTQGSPIYFDRNSRIKVEDEFEYPTLYGWIFSNKLQKNSLIINLSDRPQKVDLSPLFKQKPSYETIFGSPRDLVSNSDVLEKRTGTIEKTFVFPAYSVTRISSSSS